MDPIRWMAGDVTHFGTRSEVFSRPGGRLLPLRAGDTRRVLLGAVLGTFLSAMAALAADSTPQAPEHDTAQRVAAILEQIKSSYVEPLDDKKLIADAVNGVLKNLDAYSVYLDADAFRQMQQDNRGLYGGVGIEVGREGGAVRVLSAYEDTPASRAGLAAGDLIARVEGASVEGMNLDEVVRRVRGEPDTDVALTLVRSGEPGPRTIALTRETIQGRSVTARLIEPGYVYVRIRQFQTHTAEMMAKDIGHLIEAGSGAPRGIILDLRDNPGGVLSSAVGVSAAFLPTDAPIAFTDGAAKDSKKKLSARRSDYLRHGSDDYLEGLSPAVKTLPMVVLVNGDSASAAEIVAGALQDNKRAAILGTRTYGKGSIQVIIPLGDGTGLKLTTAYYYTPRGRLIQGKGVLPDIVVEEKFTAPSPAGAVQPVVLGSRPSGPGAEAGYSLCELHDESATPAATDETHAPNAAPAGPFSGDCQLEQALHLLQRMTSSVRS